MKELLDIYLERRLKDLLVYQSVFKSRFEAYRDKASLLAETDIDERDMLKRLEEDNFELMATHKDLENITVEMDVILDIYRKTRQELPKTYTDLVKTIDGYKEGKRSDMYTFVVENDTLVEREKGIVKVRLDMVRNSQAYKELEEINSKK